MLLKISLTPVWTSLFWHGSKVPSLTSLHVLTPSATLSTSLMNSLSFTLLPTVGRSDERVAVKEPY